MRARGPIVRRNRIDGRFTEPLTFKVSTAVVEQNYLVGNGGTCALCFSGSGTLDATGNRLMGPGGIPGMLILPFAVGPVPPMVMPLIAMSAPSGLAFTYVKYTVCSQRRGSDTNRNNGEACGRRGL